MTKVLVRVGQASVQVPENEAWLSDGNVSAGAVVCFTGLVRDDDPLDRLISLELQHYPGMTERRLASIAANACKRWELLSVVIDHRVGIMTPGEKIVHVGVASAHRQASFEACSYLMDWLKTAAPFWKREIRQSGASWVSPRESDVLARDRWQ
jgi:molybdopterin synthase catalytic subunit